MGGQAALEGPGPRTVSTRGANRWLVTGEAAEEKGETEAGRLFWSCALGGPDDSLTYLFTLYLSPASRKALK